MQVSVVIPLYNGEAWVSRTLESVRAQTLQPVDIFVVDDGSTDQSCQRVQQFPEVSLIANRKKGGGHARNLGIEQVRTPLVALLDQDDIWHPTHLEHLATLLESASQAVAAASELRTFTREADLEFLVDEELEARPLQFWRNFPFNLISTPSQVVAKRSAILEAGGFDQRIYGQGDLVLWLKLGEAGEILQSNQATAGWRVHRGSRSAYLRRHELTKYLESLRDQASIFAERRAKSHPGERESLARRVELTKLFVEVGLAIERSDKSSLEHWAKRISTLLQSEPEQIQRQATFCLLWYLQLGEMSWRERYLIASLYRYWVPGERKTFLGHTKQWSSISRLMFKIMVRGTAGHRLPA